MSPSRPPSDGVRALLEEAESELGRRLREACEAEARGISTESSHEIRKLEDALLSAAMAAGRVRAARRHLAADQADTSVQASGVAATEHGTPAATRTAATEARDTAPSATPASGETETQCDQDSEGTSVREFEDPTGRSWRAWPVTPRMSRSREASRQVLGDFQEGWICFEALDNSGRRRLPRREPRWSNLPADELQRLLEQAIDAPGRRPRKQGGTTATEGRDVH
jgi:hypothetical protein